MKEKVLILSYYFPPCNLTPSERVFSWAKYLKNGNYYPIIITRNWDVEIKNSTTDAYKNSGTETIIKKFDDYEVHYLPYNSSLKDKLFIKLDGTRLYFIYLFFSFVYNILQLSFVKSLSFKYIYEYANKYICLNNEIKKMVVTANPFELLGLGYYLSKRHSLKWLADYRDDWSTNEMQFANSIPKKVFLKISKLYEKKYLKNCTFFTTVSNHYIHKISNLINKQGFLLENGYLPSNYKETAILFDDFTITYTGSIYSAQKVELFLIAIKKFIDQGNVKIQIYFIGIAKELTILERIKKNILGYEQYFRFTERLPKKEAIEIQSKSHLLLSIAYDNLKGIPGSKIYEYIALKKLVLLYPSDKDIIEQTLLKTNQAIICSDENNFCSILNKYYNLFYNGNFNQIEYNFNTLEIEKYSREEQVKALIEILNKL